jgi:hypothetical protein
LLVGQAKPLSTQLLPQNAILLVQVFDYVSLLLVDPAGHGDQQESKLDRPLHACTI